MNDLESILSIYVFQFLKLSLSVCNLRKYSIHIETAKMAKLYDLWRNKSISID
jgi:hypothetical protein